MAGSIAHVCEKETNVLNDVGQVKARVIVTSLYFVFQVIGLVIFLGKDTKCDSNLHTMLQKGVF